MFFFILFPEVVFYTSDGEFRLVLSLGVITVIVGVLPGKPSGWARSFPWRPLSTSEMEVVAVTSSFSDILLMKSRISTISTIELSLAFILFDGVLEYLTGFNPKVLDDGMKISLVPGFVFSGWRITFVGLPQQGDAEVIDLCRPPAKCLKSIGRNGEMGQQMIDCWIMSLFLKMNEGNFDYALKSIFYELVLGFIKPFLPPSLNGGVNCAELTVFGGYVSFLDSGLFTLGPVWMDLNGYNGNNVAGPLGTKDELFVASNLLWLKPHGLANKMTSKYRDMSFVIICVSNGCFIMDVHHLFCGDSAKGKAYGKWLFRFLCKTKTEVLSEEYLVCIEDSIQMGSRFHIVNCASLRCDYYQDYIWSLWSLVETCSKEMGTGSMRIVCQKELLEKKNMNHISRAAGVMNDKISVNAVKTLSEFFKLSHCFASSAVFDGVSYVKVFEGGCSCLRKVSLCNFVFVADTHTVWVVSYLKNAYFHDYDRLVEEISPQRDCAGRLAKGKGVNPLVLMIEFRPASGNCCVFKVMILMRLASFCRIVIQDGKELILDFRLLAINGDFNFCGHISRKCLSEHFCYSFCFVYGTLDEIKEYNGSGRPVGFALTGGVIYVDFYHAAGLFLKTRESTILLSQDEFCYSGAIPQKSIYTRLSDAAIDDGLSDGDQYVGIHIEKSEAGYNLFVVWLCWNVVTTHLLCCQGACPDRSLQLDAAGCVWY